jgi:nucleoside-diphosphate kinase
VVPGARARDNAGGVVRAVMGATHSKQAAPGPIPQLYGTDVQYNAIHGSDSRENAAKELAFFFSRAEILGND